MQDRDGETLGKVADLLIDSEHGKVRFLVVEHGGVLGFGAKSSFIPIDAITRITDDVVYVGDFARSVYLALKAERPGAWVFNIGTGKAWTPRDFLNAAAKMFPAHQIELGPGTSKLGRSKQSYCVFDIFGGKETSWL